MSPPDLTYRDLLPIAAVAPTVIGTVIWLPLIKVIEPTVIEVDGLMSTVVVGVRS